MTLAILCVGQAIAYLVLVINMRAVAKCRYLGAAISEVGYALINFVMLHRIVEAHTWPEALAYAAGCTIGSLSAMWLTRHWEMT